MPSRSVAGLLLASTLAGCAPDFAVPPGVQLSCRIDADCPGGLVCKTRLQRCLPASGGDETGPAIKEGSVAIVPEVTRAGLPVLVSFAVTETLAEAPRVALGTAHREALTSVGQDGLTYTFEYLPTGGETEGVWPLLATLTDAAANRAADLALGTVRFDFTPPHIASASLQYQPAPDNPLFEVTAARDGTTVRVTFNTSEALQGEPFVRADCEGLEVRFSRVAGETSTTLFTFEHVLASDDAVGASSCRVLADLEDEATNLAKDLPVTEKPLEISRMTSSALAPAVNKARLKHLRVPWGADRTQGKSGQFLVAPALPDGAPPLSRDLDAEAFALAGASLVEARIYLDSDASQLVGRVTRTSAGWSPVRLLALDASEIWATVLDAAGNESTAARVPEVEWVATLGGKAVGDTLKNPHTFETRAWFTGSLFQPAAFESSIAAIGGGAPITRGAGTWRRVSGGADILAENDGGSTGCQIVYDSARGVTTLVGRTVSGTEAPVYTWNGVRWMRAPAADPEGDGGPALRGFAAAYDSRRGKTVIFGGRDGINQLAGETWEWDGESWQRRCDGVPQDDVCPDQPSPRESGAMAFDASRGRAVLFGGRDESANSDEIWEWDGVAWRKADPLDDAPADGNPVARWHHMMAYDPDRGRVLLFGGDSEEAGDCSDLVYGCRNDLWAWDGVRWTALAPASGPDGLPDPRVDASLIYDEALHRLVLFGGDTGLSSCDGSTGRGCGITWQLSADTWSRVNLADREQDGQPSKRWSVLAAYDSARGVSVLFGGRTKAGNGAGCYGTYCGSTWELAADDWSRRGPSDAEHDGGPETRTGAVMSYAEDRARMLVFGGSSTNCEGSGGNLCRTVWEGSGLSWAAASSLGPPHSAGGTSGLENHAQAYDPVRGKLVVFGGMDGLGGWRDETVEWDAASATWNLVLPQDPSGDGDPQGRQLPGMALDALGKVLMFGGLGFIDGGECALSGIYTPCSGTWQWDGVSWNRRCNGEAGDPCTRQPQAREDMAMAYDPDRGATVLFGGVTYTPASERVVLGDIWEWDGVDWTPHCAGGPADPCIEVPPSRLSPHLVWDAGRHRIVLYGGSTPDASDPCEGQPSYCTTVWEWDGQRWRARPVTDPDEDGRPRGTAEKDVALGGDQTRGVVVLLKGNGRDGTGAPIAPEVWEWDGGAKARPAQVARITLGPVPAGDAMTSVSALWRAGGTSFSAKAEVPGAELLVWDEGRFRPVGAEHDSASPAPLAFSTTDPLEIDGLLFGEQRLLSLAVVPRELNGQGATEAEVTSDYVEVTVKYRHP